MLDFLRIGKKHPKKNVVDIYPKFVIKKSKDLLIRGRDFYAVWDEERDLWSREEDRAKELIDIELKKAYDNYTPVDGELVNVLYMWDAETGMIDRFHKYCQKQMRDNFHELDEKIIFSNTPVKKEDYASKKLSYPLEKGDFSAWDELVGTLYSKQERHKIEWAIGSIVFGDSIKIQKFLVFYGSAGTGKSTILNIVQKLFNGYYAVFDAKALASSTNAFALEAFRDNPLVAIQHDGDLSKIEDNTRLNSLVSHEEMRVNEKFKTTYASRFNAFLFMGTNKPVKITDAKSGLLRRLIDVTPSGKKIPFKKYKQLIKKIDFELGAIAYHCQEVYKQNPDAYDNYIPTEMLGASNDFYNFIMDSYYIFEDDDGISLKAAYELYKKYCDEARVPYPFNKRIFKEELKNYFWNYDERKKIDGTWTWNYYSGFKSEKFIKKDIKKSDETKEQTLILNNTESIFDKQYKDYPAQYATKDGTPTLKWKNVKTKLSDLDTKKLHYVKIPENHIVIDFDFKDKNGNKDLNANLKAAASWPETYAEISQSGGGVHLHYLYSGDVSKISRVYDDDIEIKIFTGNSSLRRKLTKCNDKAIATISSGLPFKESRETKMLDDKVITNERAIRTIIANNLKKRYHQNTAPSVSYICDTLNKAYNSGAHYDVSDMELAVISFAQQSTHQAEKCLEMVANTHFKSDDIREDTNFTKESPIVFFDVEVFINLFLICFKFRGKDKPVMNLVNPSADEVAKLFKYRLIGFNNRKYDNHILYARYLGYTNSQLYKLSQEIIEMHTGFFLEAYNLSYTDIYDFSKTKQSLKKWEIELGINHEELAIPFDEPAPKDKLNDIIKYCNNDVLATESVFEHNHGDFLAREILASISGSTVNRKTNTHTEKIIFGDEKHPGLIYTDLSTGLQYYPGEDPKTDKGHPSPKGVINKFPGYEYKWITEVSPTGIKTTKPHNLYLNTDVGFGGYVYANPGMYGRCVTYDVASMHPHSIIALNLFGEHTATFKELMDARLAIKHKDYETAGKLFNGKLKPYLTNPKDAKALSGALKIAINSVYGLSSAGYDNPFKDKRNINNIVALRGALFMVRLKAEVEKRGFKVVHIKTDSIKIEDPTEDIAKFVYEYGKKYGYTFEIEHTWEKICLVNNAVYIGKHGSDDPDSPGEWEAVGAQFQQPYVFKKLFSKEPIIFSDMCETKSVKSPASIYLDMNEKAADDQHNYIFVGRVGQFSPVKSGCDGGLMLRYDPETKKYGAVTGTKGYRWLESPVLKRKHKEDEIDRGYYDKLVDEAVENISQYGDFEWFVS